MFFRLTDEEFENLEKYCQPTQRSKSDVFRELIRSLKVKKSPAYGRGFRPKFSVISRIVSIAPARIGNPSVSGNHSFARSYVVDA